MFKLTDRYYLTVDAYNFILNERRTVEKKKNGVKTGKTETKCLTIGYYGKLSSLLLGMAEYHIKSETTQAKHLASLHRKMNEFLDGIALMDTVAEMRKRIVELENENKLLKKDLKTLDKEISA